MTSGIISVMSQKVIAWCISGNPDINLVKAPFKKAYKNKIYPIGMIFHSNLDIKYAVLLFVNFWIPPVLYSLFSKKEYPFDNSCCECLNNYFNKEESNRSISRSLKELLFFVFQYIKGFYNSKRYHVSLGLLTPNKMRNYIWKISCNS
jgi:transposase InsO family protein